MAVGKRRNIAPVVEVHVANGDVLDVRRCEPDLRELGGHGVVLRHLEPEALGQRAPPPIGVRDGLVALKDDLR